MHGIGRSATEKEEMEMKLTKNEWLRSAGRQMKQNLVVAVLIAAMLLGVCLGRVASAQAVSTTTVQGTVYLANGQPGSGTLRVSWPAFSTANGQAVAAGSVTAMIPPDGFVSLNLAPNLGATPAGLYYTAVFYMSDGTSSTQYWVVPAAAQASLAQVQSQVMPAAQAVQAVSKAYVDQAIQALGQGVFTLSGGTLTGPLNLNGDPTQALQAADKHYVDTAVSQAVPLAGGNMTGALGTPAVNGVQAPAVGSSQTTLQTAINAAGSNGAMEIPPTYAGTDSFTNPNGVRVTDLRTSGAQQTERSVKEFGAVCDGATDDTNALQTALNYAQTHGVALTIPQGTCKTRTLNWHGESIGGMGKQVSALMGYPGQDVLVSMTDSSYLLSYTRIHDLTIYVDQSADVSCSPARGRAAGGNCTINRPMESNSIFSSGGNGLAGTVGTGAGWVVGNCAIAMAAVSGTGGNGLRVAEIENVEITTTGVDPLAAQYPGVHSTHTCGLYLAQWPQWSEFRNIDIRGLNTGIALPALPVATPAGLTADSNRWQNITIQATHGFTAAAGSNNVLDNVVTLAGNSAAAGETPTGLVLDLSGTQQGWTVRNAVVTPLWNAVQPQLTVTAAGGAVTAVAVGSEHGLGFDPYGTQVPLQFGGSCTAAATASVNSDGSIGAITVTQGGVGCSGSTTASVNVAGTWDTAAPVNLIGGQNMTLFAGNLLKGNGGYTVWNASSSQSNGTQLAGGGGTLPSGGTYAALVGTSSVGSAYQVDQFPGADFGAKLQACLSAVNATYGGTCDARNFSGTLAMGSNLTIATGNTTIELPCATIATANQMIVTAGTRNVTLRGCALRGGTQTSGSQGGTVFAYSGTGAMVQVGDPTYAADTQGFHMDDVVINTTAATSATAKGLVAYRTQEMDLESLYFLGNANQTGMTLDGTGNYTGGTYYDIALNGFQTAVNAIGHQVSNAAVTDWMNASTFVRLHINCPTSGGSPIAGTYGINLQQGDGNTFTGGDVEGCATALHLGANAQNNTIVGLRNENSTSQVVADTGSAYNNWITGGTMFTGKLTDNGTRNSFLDTFHRSFNGMNGDWYLSQQDATLTNHYRLGTAMGNERGLLNRYQTDYGYRWTMGLSDATAGEQFYQVLDELNNVYRLSIGQYNNGQTNTNNQTVINAAGTGSVLFNGSTNAGTGGVVFASGGSNAAAVATINNAGNAQFNGTLQVGGTSTFAGSTTVKNQADAEIDQIFLAGATTSQKESLTYKDWNGTSQWYALKDASNNWALNSAIGGLDSFKAYQSTNSGDTYINASNSTGVVRVNYETGAGAGFKVYGGSSSSLYASFTGTTSIQFPGLAAVSGHYCLQIDDSGYVSNTGSACGSGTGTTGTINTGNVGQIAYYTASGAALGGVSTVPLAAGGTGAATAAAALENLGGISSTSSSQQTLAGPLGGTSATFSGTVTGQKVGAVYQADQFSGADASVQMNACIAAVIAVGGGTCDASGLGGAQTLSEQINVGSEVQANSATNTVTLILPDSGNWTITIADGTSCGIMQYSNTTIMRKGEAGGGGGNRIILGTTGSTRIDSIYCTDPNPTSGGSYVRAGGFWASNSVPSALATGVFHVQKLFDESHIHDMGADVSQGNIWVVDGTCCGTSFDHIQGFAGDGTDSGYPLHVLRAMATSFRDSTFNGPGTGKNNILVEGAAGVVNGLTFSNIYEEKYTNDATPINKIVAGAQGVHFEDSVISGSGSAANICFENDSTNGFVVTNTTCSYQMTTEINDVAFGRTWSGMGGYIANYQTGSTYAAGSQFGKSFLQGSTSDQTYLQSAGQLAVQDAVGGVSFTPTATGWYRLLNTGGNIDTGEMRIQGYYNNNLTSFVADFVAAGYNNLLLALRDVNGFNSPIIDQIEVSQDNSGNGYLDVHVATVVSASPITVSFHGLGIVPATIVSSPVVGATPATNRTALLSLPNGGVTAFNTTGNVQAPGFYMPGASGPVGMTANSGGDISIAPPYNNVSLQAGSSGNPRTLSLLGSNGTGIAVDSTGDATVAGYIANSHGTLLPSGLTGYHGSSATKVQLSDGTGANGPAYLDNNGNVTGTPTGMSPQICQVTAPPYSADCDGSTDDTSKIQAAMDACPAIALPKSTATNLQQCNVSSLVQNNAVLTIYGNGSLLSFSGTGNLLSSATATSPGPAVQNLYDLNVEETASTATPVVFDMDNLNYVNLVNVFDLGGGGTNYTSIKSTTDGSFGVDIANSTMGGLVSLTNTESVMVKGSTLSGSASISSIGGNVSLDSSSFLAGLNLTGEYDVSSAATYTAGTLTLTGVNNIFGNMGLASAPTGTPIAGTFCYTISTAPVCMTYGPAQVAGNIANSNGTLLPSNLTGYHGTSGTKVQLSDGTGTSGDYAKFAGDGSITDGGAGSLEAAVGGVRNGNGSGADTAANSHNLSVPANCVAASGSGTAYTCSTSPTFTPARGDHIQFMADVANTGSATLAVNGVAAAAIKKLGGSGNVVASDLLAGHWVSATFDGTNWQLEGQLGQINATQVNGVALSGLATGLVKNTTGTGSPTIAVAGTDYALPNANTTGYAAGIAGGAVGSLPYQSGANTTALLAPNTTTTKCFVQEKGTGSAGQAPSCAALVSGDIPANGANTTGTAAGLSSTLTAAMFPSLSGDVTNTAGSLSMTVKAVNGVAIPASKARLASDASGHIVAAANTLGCLDGFDHLPCVVYAQSNVSESTPTGSYGTVWTSTYAGTYRITGYIYGTTASSTAYTVSNYVKATQNGQSSGNGYMVASAQIGTTISSGSAYAYVFPLAASTAVQTESLLSSGTNTGGVWSHAIIVERLQ